jgi:hypothetical protein
MRDVQTSTSSSSDKRLERLLVHRAAWQGFRLQAAGHYSQPNYCHAYDYVSGFFVKCFAPDFMEAYRKGSLLYTFTNLRKPAFDAARFVELDVHTKDFAIDPSQDLFVVLEMFDLHSVSRSSGDIRVHLRSFTHPHEPHLEARIPVLQESHGFRIKECLLEVAEDALALFAGSETESIFIWNWRSGRLLVVRAYCILPPTFPVY